MKTINFNSEIGVNKEYDSEKNGQITKSIENIGKLFQELQLEVQKETGIYVSTVVKGPNRTVYNTEWGCPAGGEITYNISSVANPEFTPNEDEWKKASLLLMHKARTALKQTTVSVEFNGSDGPDFYYLNSDNAYDNAIKEINEQTNKFDFLNKQ